MGYEILLDFNPEIYQLDTGIRNRGTIRDLFHPGSKYTYIKIVNDESLKVKGYRPRLFGYKTFELRVVCKPINDDGHLAEYSRENIRGLANYLLGN